MSTSELLPTEDREVLMLSGISQMQQWLQDTLRVGLLKIDFEPAIDQISSLMVDAKCGSIARRLQRLKDVERSNPDWGQYVVRELTLIYTLCEALRSLKKSDVQKKLALFSIAGLNFRKEKIIQLPGIEDTWLVMSHRIHQEENLRVRRCWILGRKTHRMAVVIDFVFGRARFDSDLKVGMHYVGTAHYYPALFNMRAAFANKKTMNIDVDALPGYTSFERFMVQYAKAIAKDPWISRFPACLGSVTIHPQNKTLVDKHGSALALANEEGEIWQLAAVSGGNPLALFGEYDGRKLWISSIHHDRRISALT